MTFDTPVFSDASDPYRLGHGSIRRHLLRQEGLPHSRYQALEKPSLGGETSVPRPTVRHPFIRTPSYSIDPIHSRYETAFKVQLSVLDWDKLSSNDHIGDTSFDVADLVLSAPQPDPQTGLYDPKEVDGEHPMKEYQLKLETSGTSWDGKFKPTISVR